MKANSEWYSLCDIYVHCTLGLVKWDLWGFGAESWFVVASYAFAKMIPQSFWQKEGLLKVALSQKVQDSFFIANFAIKKYSEKLS